MTRQFLLAILLLAAILSSSAQIQVSKEPRHHNVFENGWVRVLDVRIPPGDTSLMHKHSTPSVFMVLTNTKTGSQVITEPAKIHLTEGNIWFEGFYDKPRIHRVWNSDTSEFHVIDLELLNKDPKPIDPPLDMKTLTLLFDEKPVRGYRFTLAAQSSFTLPHRKAPMLAVLLTDAMGNLAVNNKPFAKKGDYLFIPAGNSSTSFINKGSADQHFVFFELK